MNAAIEHVSTLDISSTEYIVLRCISIRIHLHIARFGGILDGTYRIMNALSGGRTGKQKEKHKRGDAGFPDIFRRAVSPFLFLTYCLL